MGLATLLKKLGSEHGIEIDDDELTQLGLSDDETELVSSANDVELDVLDEVLSGEAAGAVELYVDGSDIKLADGAVIQDGFMWEPIIRAGQWAVRPGARGQKRRAPLKVVSGHSKNQRKQIGLQDIVDAFNDEAIQHVTVPTSHDNTVLENTGFIKKLKIVKAKVKDLKTKQKVDVDVLMGAYDIRLPKVKEKMQLGTIANRSAGLLYDYVNTETGKTYPVVLEHVALTNKPWITGMKAFGRKLVGKKLADTIGLSLSDEEPSDIDQLSDEDALDGLELADTNASAWTQDEDPDWLREQASNFLRQKRAEKAAKLTPAGVDRWVVMDGIPNYRCVRAKPGTALIADDWGDQANFWTAPIKVVDGFVEVDDNLENWQAVKREFVPDADRKEFPEGREPLAEQVPEPTAPPVNLSRLQLAQKARRERAAGPSTTDEGAKPENNETTSRGGEHMEGSNGALQLSDEARRLVQAAEDRAKEAEAKAAAADARIEKLSQTVERLVGASAETTADQRVAKLVSDGFTEDKGWSGVLAVCRDLFAADDGEPAVQSDKFSDDTNATGELSLSDAIMRIFDAVKRGEDGKIALGEQVTQPATPAAPGATKEDETTDEKLGDDGKPLPKDPEQKAFEELSDDEQLEQLAKDNPSLFQKLRLAIPAATGGES